MGSLTLRTDRRLRPWVWPGVFQFALGFGSVLALLAAVNLTAFDARQARAAEPVAAPHPFCEMVETGRHYEVCRNYCRYVMSTTYSAGADMLFCQCGQGMARIPLDCR